MESVTPPRDGQPGNAPAIFDSRGLVELNATVPRVSEIDGERATFDARELTTRKINLELRWLLYEQGVTDVTVRNPARATRSASASSPAAGSPSRARSATSAAASSTGPRSTSPAASAGRRART